MASIFEELEDLLGKPDEYSKEDFIKSFAEVRENTQRIYDLFNQQVKENEKIRVQNESVLAIVCAQYGLQYKGGKSTIKYLQEQGFTTAEISRLLGISTNTVRNRVKT